MFGDIVKERRKARNWTQQELAERVGVTTPYISMIEGKKRGQEPGYDVLVAMADAFGTTVEELRAAANQDATFPMDDLIAEGLKPAIAQHLATQWDAVPINQRRAILTKAKNLARLYKEVDRIERSITDEASQAGSSS
jgi:transcriptional regulator with XRE-family HTH domain